MISSQLVLTLFAIFTCSCWAASAYGHEHFLECLDYEFKNSTLLKNTVYTPRKSSHRYSTLESPVRNLRFKSESTPKQLVVVNPEYKFQIPLVIRCAEENGLQIRVTSGLQALEGLSDVSEDHPFVILDMIKLGETAIDAEQMSASRGGVRNTESSREKTKSGVSCRVSLRRNG